jgi:hypothetical protein
MALCPGDTLQKLARLRQNSILLGGLSLSPRARDGLAPHRFSYLAVKAAVVLGVDPGHSDVKFTCKLGKRASRGPARCVSREPVEECQGHVDHTLLTELAAPSFAAVLGSARGGYDLCKRE